MLQLQKLQVEGLRTSLSLLDVYNKENQRDSTLFNCGVNLWQGRNEKKILKRAPG